MSVAQPGNLHAMTQNSNGTVQYSYVTTHPIQSVLDENYFIHSAHILKPGDYIRVISDTKHSLSLAELVVTKSDRMNVTVADWNGVEWKLVGKLMVRRVRVKRAEDKGNDSSKG